MGRLRPVDLVAGAGGLVLLASLFLRWYGVDAGIGALEEIPGGDDRGLTGWQSFTAIDVLLALVALLAVAVPLAAAAVRGPALPVALTVIGTVLGALAALLVALRLLIAPGWAVDLRLGAWVGLAGALLACAGSFLALKDESTPGAVPPDVPRRPAPPAA
jgi:hypothetical protein